MSVLPPLPADDLDFVLQETAGLWNEIRGWRILVTGATGFFGRWMLESVVAADRRFDLGVEVVALSRDPDKFLRGSPQIAAAGTVAWARGSVTTLTSGEVPGKFDAIIHLATESDMAATLADPAAAVDVITGGTRRALEVARQTGARRFLFTSSGSVYGQQPATLALIPETFRSEPNPATISDAYAIGGEAKRQAELLCAAAAENEGLGAVIARCFTFAGPGLPLNAKFAFGNFLQDALAERPIVIQGDGTPIRSYLYAADLTIWLWTLLLRGRAGRAYNVGSEQALPLRELAETMSRELGSPGVRVLQPATPGVASHRYAPSTERARTELGLKQHVNLEAIIRRTAAWQRLAGKR